MYKFDLYLKQPLMNTAGSLGFAPDRSLPLDLSLLGAFVTNPVSREPRTPARGPRVVEYPGGFLLHTGYPNPGLRTVIRRYSGRWAQLPIPVIVHLLALNPEDVYQAVLDLESVESVGALELGLPPGVTAELAQSMLQAAQGERPVILRFPYENALDLGKAVLAHPGAGVSLAPPRGLLYTPENRAVTGRLYGPAVLPLMLPVVRSLVDMGLSVFGGGGVYTSADAGGLILRRVQLRCSLTRFYGAAKFL
jgi:dihydroorotate dehydrogenase (NAD+) catalytic subunit